MNGIAVFYEHIFEAAEQSGKSIEEVLRLVKECGIDYLECDMARLGSGKEAKRLFDSCGMKVSQIYRHFDFTNGDMLECRSEFMELIFAANYFGAKNIMCIPGFLTEGNREAQMSRVVSRLSEVCHEASCREITVTVEDFDDINSPCCKTEDIKYLLDGVFDLKFTLDTGNFRYCGEDVFEAKKQFSDRIAHVHLKDRSYDRANSNADNSNGKADIEGRIMYPSVVGEGEIGIKRIISELKAENYGGIYVIEHFGAVNQLEYIRKSADNIRSALL